MTNKELHTALVAKFGTEKTAYLPLRQEAVRLTGSMYAALPALRHFSESGGVESFPNAMFRLVREW